MSSSSSSTRPQGSGRNGHLEDGHRPLSVGEIAKEADKYEWKPQVPLKYWIGALQMLYREGKNYLLDGNYPKAYLLLLRYASLYMKDVSTHPDAKLPENKRLLKPVKDRLPRVFSELEEIKPIVQQAYEEWASMTAASNGKKPYSTSLEEGTLSSYEAFATRDAALSWNPRSHAKIIDAADHQDLAVDLATKELMRRSATRAAERRSSGGIGEDRPRHRGGSAALSVPRHELQSDTLQIQQQMESIRWQLDHRQQQREEQEDRVVPGSYSYPSISKSTPVSYDRDTPRDSSSRTTPSQPPRPPRPPKHATPSSETRADLPKPPAYRYDAPPQVPLRPSRDAFFSDDSPLSNSLNHQTVEPSPLAPKLPPKTVETPPKPAAKVTFKPAGYLENGDPIRPIFLPGDLRKDFVRLAADNTSRGIETCGLLCGTVVNNALFVSTLLIPKQTGTSDTCETTDEAATFEFMEKEDLIQLGWIHTHPTQTCFMSSRDLHTQAGYQIMMPESIAIVCSPRHEPSWGIFRLTNPPGLPHLLKCNQTTTFHEHAVPANELYLSARHPPGHVYVTDRMAHTVHDQRS